MPRTVLTIGHFDGVHLGHRALLSAARSAAAARGDQVVAMTFSQHPAAILRPAAQPPRLLPTDEKVRRLTRAGADRVIVLDPSRDLLSQSAERFVEKLVEEHQPNTIVEGEDFRFGRGRYGDVAMLARLGEQMGFETVVQPKETIALANQLVVTVSSSMVRWLIGHAHMIDAARCMTEPFSLSGRVVEGQRQGRTLGIPTANLDPADYADFILPPDGVYAGYASVEGEQGDAGAAEGVVGGVHAAAISLGVKPTFAGQSLTLEAHLLDFDGDLYGKRLRITFTRWLRDQYAYPSIQTLTAQLARDLEAVRSLAADEPLAA